MPIYSNEDFTVISLRLTVWKVMIEIVTVVKFRENYGGGSGAVCFEVKVWAAGPPRGGGVAGASAPGPGGPKGARRAPSKL